MNVRPHYLDVTKVIDHNEVASAFGPIVAWQATITRLRHKEAKTTDRRTKQQLRLQLLNAENQLRLLTTNKGDK